MKTLFLTVYLLAISISLSLGQTISGVVNSYARVTAINTGTNVVTIDNLNGSIIDFDAGEKVLLIQMKGVTIDGTNTATFGDILSYNNAGNYEMASIQLLNDLGGGSYEITLNNINRTYTPGTPGGYVQVVSVPQYTNVTINGTVTPATWNDSQGTGGIVTFEVSGTLTLGANVDVSQQGFGGGVPNTTGDGGCIRSTDYARNAGSGGTSDGTHQARKGLGVATEISNMEYGRANLANGGGGGNTHNAGGGGGGNYTAGGVGGIGWPGSSVCSGSIANGGGLGGIALDYSAGTNKVFMGGGGGGGQQNNNNATVGGRGGGMIIIRANIVTTSCGGTYGFLANGEDASITAGNDGGGGGGAGGAILLEVNQYNLPCAIVAHANGGNGADVDDGAAHGGGGGGGVGPLLVNNPPGTPAVFSSTPGIPGNDCNAGSPGCDATGTDGGTCSSCTDSGWTVPGTTIPLPIELGKFSVKLTSQNTVDIRWVTISEKNTSHFIIEKTTDFHTFSQISRTEAVGNSIILQHYSAQDNYPHSGINYYRLKSVDIDGATSYSKWQAVNYQNTTPSIDLYPNPAKDDIRLVVKTGQVSPITVYVINQLGQGQLKQIGQTNQTMQILVNKLPAGMYTVMVVYQQQKFYKALIINR
ncbi:T9SS type A sorting domain-containing protein [uncultured Microscilla sp.]|uniref:T9SS type A sorting domain-containing protein n=1 Tax=uncultured Microscilla sp. TaxID=432653 RepID=UPI002609E8ED|nr:T9SS type A sorting domain-containing protein [uncultured Microscilla sp.]